MVHVVQYVAYSMIGVLPSVTCACCSCLQIQQHHGFLIGLLTVCAPLRQRGHDR